MATVVEPNWNNFRAKFNGKEQRIFEWFCSLLFYQENGCPTGALRYFNQTGIEADPISVGEEVIGWQAKFISASISSQKQTLIKAIGNAKTENPTLTQLWFYLNRDFSESTKKGVKDPAYKTEIEGYAKSIGVDIHWRTAGFFETPFVCEQNAHIANHFFTLGEKSVIDFINELVRHTKAILQPIRSEITFAGKTIKIDRSDLATSLKTTLSASPLVIVSGEAGVGKTAVIKDLYEEISQKNPVIVFKANEFAVASVNEIFEDYGKFGLSDFMRAYEDEDEKYIVIDSAEKLSDIEYPDVFQEFLSTVRQKGWKIIFATRLSYLDDLKHAFIQIYNVKFEPFVITNISHEELVGLAKEYRFELPQNERLQNRLQNPFWLNEYLQLDPVRTSAITFSEFTDAIWNRQIACTFFRKENTHIQREDCFLEIARRRATTGNFFVTADGFDDAILRLLEEDEVIKFDSSARGYFITHDIYEELALDKWIEHAYRQAANHKSFYDEIGSSLAIRRAFRSWLSEKLVADSPEVMDLIEETIGSSQADRHWQDEVLVAVLLSRHAHRMIDHFDRKLLELPSQTGGEDNLQTASISSRAQLEFEGSLLHRILFLLRIACKEIDQNSLRLLGLAEVDAQALPVLFTIPKGPGWRSIIGFINTHKDELGLTFLPIVLPVLDDWTRNFKEGETTKNAGQIALFYYNELTKDDVFGLRSGDETRDKLVSTILNASGELETELTDIVDEVVRVADTSYRGRYYKLVSAALSSITESSEIATNLPIQVIRLANLFWFDVQEDSGWSSDFGGDIEHYFGLASNSHDYYPASALQTPTLGLLRSSPQEAVDFLLSLTNKAIDHFAKSELGGREVEEVEVYVDSTTEPVRQYVCDRIWNIYRGTQVAPNLLASIHMALERWLLMFTAKSEPADVLEAWCLYLIRNTKSASITAIVTSVVLAEPSKLFRVAEVLFRTKDFFFFDLSRWQLDQTARDHYAICHDPIGLMLNERIKTCDDEHRKHSLEDQALKYQLFRESGEDEATAKERQQILWQIFDAYYDELPGPSRETDADKKWRLSLARMDRRKMDISTEEKDGQVLIRFNPELDPSLKKYSEDGLAESTEAMKYTPLMLWSRYRFERNEDEFKKYSQYEDNPGAVLSETRAVEDQLGRLEGEQSKFELFYRSVPPSACGILIRDFPEMLSEDERDFCKDIILKYASLPRTNDYQYQVGDGVDIAISVLPSLLGCAPNESDRIVRILLLAMFDDYPVGISQRFSDYAVTAIRRYLWDVNPGCAQSLFLGYLALKPRVDQLTETFRLRSYESGGHGYSHRSLLDQFEDGFAADIESVISGQISYSDLSKLPDIDPATLATGFMLLPLPVTDKRHRRFIRDISPIVWEAIRENDRDDRLDYNLQHQFIEKLASVILTSEEDEREAYLEPFLEGLGKSRDSYELIDQLVFTQDQVERYDEFWSVWNLLYSRIVELCSDQLHYAYSEEAVRSYLFASQPWQKGVRKWHSLRDRERAFLRRVAEDIGNHPSVLYSLSKLFNEIGNEFAQDGVFWISDIVKRDPDLVTKKLEVNTVYYLDNLVRGYVLRNRHKVRTSTQLKSSIVALLNFLIEKGSVTAYMLREDIL